MTGRLLLFTTLVACLHFTVSAVIDEKIVKLSLRAMELVEKLQDESTSGLDDATFYKDGSDAALLANETVSGSNYCFVIFDTTKAFSLIDWLKNIDPRTEEICVLGGGPCCTARRGYQRAFAEPDYTADLELAVFDCFGERIEIVLAGHSAGGAIATAAAVALSELDPLVLTFGQPEAIVGDCEEFNEDKYFHWVNTVVNGGGDDLEYDPVPDLSLTDGTKKYGQLILMGDDEDNVVRFGSENAPASMATWGSDLWAHRSSKYIDRLQGYQDRAGDLSSEGWKDGSLCNMNEECRSGRCEGVSYWESGTCES